MVGVTPSGPVKANSGVRSGVAAAGKVLEGDDQQSLSALYYDFLLNYQFITHWAGVPSRILTTCINYCVTWHAV